MQFLEIPIGVGLISSVGVRIKDLAAPKAVGVAGGRRMSAALWGRLHTVGESGRIKCWALSRGGFGSSCRLVVFLPLP
jgi:hypothetical protein